MKKYRVYVAGKLNDMACDYNKNIHNMIKDAEEVRNMGFSVFIPGLEIVWGIVVGNLGYKDYFDNSQPWLDVSDAIYVRGKNWKTSSGTQREIKRARKQNIPVFFKHNNGLEKMVGYFKNGT